MTQFAIGLAILVCVLYTRHVFTRRIDLINPEDLKD